MGWVPAREAGMRVVEEREGGLGPGEVLCLQEPRTLDAVNRFPR